MGWWWGNWPGNRVLWMRRIRNVLGLGWVEGRIGGLGDIVLPWMILHHFGWRIILLWIRTTFLLIRLWGRGTLTILLFLLLFHDPFTILPILDVFFFHILLFWPFSLLTFSFLEHLNNLLHRLNLFPNFPLNFLILFPNLPHPLLNLAHPLNHILNPLLDLLTKCNTLCFPFDTNSNHLSNHLFHLLYFEDLFLLQCFSQLVLFLYLFL